MPTPRLGPILALSLLVHEACVGTDAAADTFPRDDAAAVAREAQPSPNPALEKLVARGREVFEHPLDDGNSFACATCHALSEPAPDGLRRPGHPLSNATTRSKWKNGRAATFLEAVNSCVTEWMVAPGWESDDSRFLAIRALISSQATTEHADNLTFEIQKPPTELSGGDVDRGRDTFNKTCVVCHGAGAGGTDRGPSLLGSRRAPNYIAQRVRTSGSPQSAAYDGLTGGVMPFWAKDRLSDDELRDMIAFITSTRTADGASGNSMSDGGALQVADARASDGTSPLPRDAASTQSDGPRSCPKTHPRISWKADLGVNTGEGQVSGFVTMIDDCTLRLTNFSYDGNGIEVRVYGSKSASFRPGFAIGPDLFGHVFNNATLDVTLPSGSTLDDLDYVSIWCVKAGANFGSGPFLAP